jgi:pimeloyl-ACP methyl ester carboxylesterase
MNSDLKRVSLPLGMTPPWMIAVAILVQNSHARVIPNAGHMTMIEAAQAVNDAIQEIRCSYSLTASREHAAHNECASSG